MEVKKRQNRKVNRETGKAGNDLLPATGNHQTEKAVWDCILIKNGDKKRRQVRLNLP
jgi:hypothetical protein